MTKKTLFLFLTIITNFAVQAQVHFKDAVVANSPVNIASEKINKLYVEPPVRLKSTGSVKSEFEVTYVGFPEDAKKAFQYAVSIWESLISSPVPVKVLAKWENIDGNVLALSRPSAFYVNFDGAPLSNVYYPVSLAEKLAGKDINSGEPDIVCSFNNNYSWYFGTDGNTPVSQYDFVSSVLHEITHGLGVSGFLKDDGGTGFFDNSENLPGVYDYFIFNSQNQQISDKSLFNSPSSDLHQQLTSNELKFSHPEKSNDKTVEWIYAPTKWNEGSSIYHTNNSGYDNGLMTPFACKGAAIHNPEGATLEILSRMGWKSVSFDFEEMKDIEVACAELPVKVGIFSDMEIDSSTVQLVYSTDYFATSKAVKLQFDDAVKQFSGNIPLDFYQGNVQYYFEAKTAENQLFKLPAQAPSKKFILRVGPDYSAPELVHNPVKFISARVPELDLSVIARDNIGIKSVKVEYRLNGVVQEPVVLAAFGNDNYKGSMNVSCLLKSNQQLEYRLVAEDNSIRGNKKMVPSSGYFSVDVFSELEPVSSYINDFENVSEDFLMADFGVSRVPGFTSGILHSRHPYPNSILENEKYNLVAQLRHPVILQENGKMTFDEVVLVEPGEKEAVYTESLFWDYVIVEGSSDNGYTWQPLTTGYDSGADDKWNSAFNGALTNNSSVAVGNEGLFVRHEISLTGNNNFSAGDVLILRFRLASDKTVSGWGWAIDNLEIQNTTTGNDKLMAESKLNVYPNPFRTGFYVDCPAANGFNPIEIKVADLYGNTVYQNLNYTPSETKIRIELADSKPGIYLVSVSDGNSLLTSNKIVKY